MMGQEHIQDTDTMHVTDIVGRSDLHENLAREHSAAQIIMLIAIMEIKQSAPLITIRRAMTQAN